MRDAVWIPREQVIACIRGEGWVFKRQTTKVEIYKLRGSPQRLTIMRRKLLPEKYVVAVLVQAGCSKEAIEEFLKKSIKDDPPH